MATAPQPGIDRLYPKVFNSFKGGRVTSMNLTQMTDEMSLIASNVLFLGNRSVTKRPGYSLVQALTAKTPVLSLFDFERESDGAQFLLSQQPGLLNATPVTGGAIDQLSNTEDGAAKFSYSPSAIQCYLSNGKASHRLIDKGGVLTMFNWGIQAPTIAATIALAAGTATTTYGWQYVYCWVSKITDAQGNTHVSVGPPSPVSAFTGPLTSQQVNGSNLEQTPDPQVTHIWIFRTFDEPANSSATFNFDQEITIGTTGVSDSLPDTSLDQTRPAPFENFPAPLAQMILQFQSRMVALGITGSPTLCQLSGFSEILVGIPQEAWPPDLFFDVPVGDPGQGSQAVSGGAVFGTSRLMIANGAQWCQLRGNTVATFELSDKVLTPGCAGFKLVLVTDHYMIWLGPDKRLWAWDGTYPAVAQEISKKLKMPVTGIGLSMQDLSIDQLSQCELRWYEFGQYDLVVLVASTTSAAPGVKDWIQVWDASFIGDTLSDESIATLAESDFFPSDLLTTSALVDVAGSKMLFFGDVNGNIYKWPSGYSDNGKFFAPVWGTIFSGLAVFIGPMFHPLPIQEVVKNLFFVDIQSDRQDAATAFGMLGVALPSPNALKALYNLNLGPFYAPEGTDPTCARAYLANLQGMSVGRWARFVVQFPVDGDPATLWSLTAWARPIYGGVP